MKRDWIEYSCYNCSSQKNGPTTYNLLFVDFKRQADKYVIDNDYFLYNGYFVCRYQKKSSLSYLKHYFYVTKIDTKTQPTNGYRETKPTLFTTMVEKSKK